MALTLRYTYGHDPSTSDRDAVRFLVGDINPARPLLDDREVDWALTQEQNLNLAAAICAEALFGKFASQGDTTVGPVSKAFSKVAELMKAKAEQLRCEAAKYALPSFPATRYTTKCALEEKSDLIPPEFEVAQFDNPFAVQLNDGLDEARFRGYHSH